MPNLYDRTALMESRSLCYQFGVKNALITLTVADEYYSFNRLGIDSELYQILGSQRKLLF